MISTKTISRSNKVAQNHGAVARAAVDQAAVAAAHNARVAAEQAKLAAKVATAYVGGFVRSFLGK